MLVYYKLVYVNYSLLEYIFISWSRQDLLVRWLKEIMRIVLFNFS